MSNVICSKNNGDEIIIKNEECSGGKISKYDITNDENTINLNRFEGVSDWLYNYYNPSTEYSNYITYCNNSSDMIRRIADDDSIFSTDFKDAYIRIPTNISYSLQLLGNSFSDGEDITTTPSTKYTKPMEISSIMNCGNTTISDDGSNTKISVSDLLTVTISTSFINSLVDSGFCNTNTSTNYYIDISEYCFRLPESQMYDSSDVVRQRDIKYTYNLSGINVNSLSLNNNIPNYMNFMASYINDTKYPIITALYKIIYSESGKATEHPKIEILKNNCENECECETISASLSENLFGFNREASKIDVNEFIDKFTYSVNALIDFILSNTNNDNILDDMTEYINNLFLDKYEKLAKWVIWSDFVQAIDIENIGEWVGFVKQNSLLVLENDITGSLNNDTIGKYTFVIKGTDGHHKEYFSMAPIPIPKSDYNFDLSEISDYLTSFGEDKYEISKDYTPPLRDKVFEANAKEICEAITCTKGTSECYQVKSNGNINFDIGLDIKIGNYYKDNNGNEYSGITDTYLMNTLLTKSDNNRLVAIGYQNDNKKVQLRMNQNELSKHSEYYFKINYKGSSTDIRYIRGDKINDYLSSESPHTNQCLGAVFTSTCLDKKYYTNGKKGGTESDCDGTNYGNLIYGFAKGQDDYDDGSYIKVNTESGGKINRSTIVNWLGYNGNFDSYGSYGYTGSVDNENGNREYLGAIQAGCNDDVDTCAKLSSNLDDRWFPLYDSGGNPEYTENLVCPTPFTYYKLNKYKLNILYKINTRYIKDLFEKAIKLSVEDKFKENENCENSLYVSFGKIKYGNNELTDDIYLKDPSEINYSYVENNNNYDISNAELTNAITNRWVGIVNAPITDIDPVQSKKRFMDVGGMYRNPFKYNSEYNKDKSTIAMSEKGVEETSKFKSTFSASFTKQNVDTGYLISENSQALRCPVKMTNSIFFLTSEGIEYIKAYLTSTKFKIAIISEVRTLTANSKNIFSIYNIFHGELKNNIKQIFGDV